MKEFNPQLVIEAILKLSGLLIIRTVEQNNQKRLSVAKYNLTKLSEVCTSLNLPVTVGIANDNCNSLTEEFVASDGYLHSCVTLSTVFRKEIGGILLFNIPQDKARYYKQPRLFGDKVFEIFPDAATDIEEAGNCLSLGRGTATVFHAMRAMEAGLRILESKLDVTRQNTWNNAIQGMNASIKKQEKDLRPDLLSFYQEAVAYLDHVRIVWRNTTMHVERTYTVEEAEDILNSVKSFMRHLANRLP